MPFLGASIFGVRLGYPIDAPLERNTVKNYSENDIKKPSITE